MRFYSILPVVALGSALVLPPEQVFSEIEIEDHHSKGWYEEAVAEKDHVLSNVEESVEEATRATKHAWNSLSESSRNAIDEAFNFVGEAKDSVSDKYQETADSVKSWFEETADEAYNALDEGHHGPDHGHRRPHEPPHHGKPNLTVYQLISESKYTTKLAKLINDYPDIVEALNSTKANYTVFAPTDKAFAKIPDHAPKPSKEQLKKVLQYHVVPDLYPAFRVLKTHTVPTLLKSDSLGSEPQPQRLAFKINLRGLTVNFYSRIIAINIFGTNGVIHGVDSIIIPPPNVIEAIDLFPGGFSTLELGLVKTGLLDLLNSTDHAGGTFFAPNNFAFQKLGPRINAFLFSKYGQKYLKALLEYHVVPDNTLYSDAYYKAGSSSPSDTVGVENAPKGYFHIDLPTMLKDRNLAVDIARYGGFISIKVNAFARVGVQDGICEDGVIQVMDDVIVPPKKVGGPGSEEVQYWDGESEMSVEEFVDRFEGLVPKADL